MIAQTVAQPIAKPVAAQAVEGGNVSSIAQIMDALYDYRYSAVYQESSATTPATGTDAIGFLQDLTGNAPAYQDTSGRRPLLSSGAWDFDGTDDQLQGFARTDLTSASAFTVPDLSDSITGKGFTCTGIALDSSDGTLWIANDGRSNGADSSHRAGLVNVTTAGVLVVERDLSGAYPSMTTIQGVVYDATDDTLWFCSTAENLVRHVSAADGSDIGSFTVTSAPNGIAVNTVNGELIVSYSGGLATYSKAGAQQATFSFDPCDSLYYDSATGILYYAMEPGNAVNFIGLFHLATRQYLTRYVVTECNALEGLVLDGATMYVTNDSYFHGSTGTNQVRVYNLPAVPTVVTQNKITLVAKFAVDSAVASARSVVACSSGGVTNAGVGLYVISNSTTGLRVFANTGAGTTERSFVDFTSLSDLATARYVLVEIDLTAEEVRLWLDGTQIGAAQAIANVNGGVSTGLFQMGGAKFGSDEMAGVMKVAGLANRFLTTAEKARLHAYLAAA